MWTDNTNYAIENKQIQALLKMSVDEMLIHADPVDRLRKNRSCVARISDTYASLADFYEDVVERLLYKTCGRMLRNVMQQESEDNPYDMHETIKPFLAKQPEVKKVYISVMSESVWDNFLLNTVSGKTGECKMDPVEVVFVEGNEEVDTERIPVCESLTMDNAKEVLESNEFPFDKEKIYLLKQNLHYLGREELHYYLYIPQTYFK